MPADLLPLNIASATLELIRRMATTRRWRWSTIARALSNVQSALLNISLYSNVQTAINLDTWPEFRAAKRAAIRFEKEIPAQPPPPLNYEQTMAARKHLRTDQRAELFLAMLWAFAARAGDIGGLNGEDVQMEDLNSATVKIAITIRRGKGARFRGPYVSASVMDKDMARELQRAILASPKDRRIFPDATKLRQKVRSAIKTILPQAALPSIRKGSARHLAQLGVPEADIARLMGHKNLDTLRRYLGYADNPTIESRQLQDRVARTIEKPQA
jgi:integrase